MTCKFKCLSFKFPPSYLTTLRYEPEGRGFDSRWRHWNFSWHNTSGRTNGPGVDSASNRNEYQEYFLEIKAAGAQGWQLYHLHVPTVMKAGSLNLLEPSGPGQASNGIALPYDTRRGMRCASDLFHYVTQSTTSVTQLHEPTPCVRIPTDTSWQSFS